ncbi:adenylate kinase 2 [Candidatus Endolissoclinum faulkneri L2]|uniref:Adenylate kinase n=1 Tax=Candidatus Endolissoclinum faulkneri L2 TaxID=1193729 RepID=K7YLQ6_9PROT|nr:adenylate kinase [Candidatus Endolissoclinum faulkneri]AFX98417.1 adenylate kinase 2 [Candidatus Endolissoclinum faulkneri L2]
MNLILLGPPGAGKGTQAKRLEKRLGVKQLSTGDMLRRTISSASDIAHEIKAVIDAGNLVSDNIIMQMISERIDDPDCSKGFILDGFPRNIAQANALEYMLSQKSLRIDHVIEFCVDKEQMVKRILKRATEENRSDDNDDTIRKRMSIYHEQTSSIVPYYQGRFLLNVIDAMKPMDDVTSQIEKILAV